MWGLWFGIPVLRQFVGASLSGPVLRQLRGLHVCLSCAFAIACVWRQADRAFLDQHTSGSVLAF